MTDIAGANSPPPPGGAAAPGGFSVTSGYRTYVLAMLLIVYTFNFIDRQIVAILQVPIKEEFGLMNWQLGLMTGLAFALFYTFLGLPIARIVDRGANRVTVISIALALWSFMTVLCGVAQNFFQLLLARVGVGVGEAGCTPPAHSMIADYYKKEERGRAMGVYAMGIPIGAFIGTTFAGIIAHEYGWRVALFAAGIPGILLAIVFKLTIKDPPRGYADAKPAERSPEIPLATVFATLWRKKSFRYLILGGALCSFCGYGAGALQPLLFNEAFGMTIRDLGIWLGLFGLVTGVLGTYLGGWMGDKFGATNPKRFVQAPMWGLIISLPFHVAAMFMPTWQLWMLVFFLPALLNNLWIAPVFALAQGLAPLAMRAMATAVMLFVVNLIGLGFGPVVVGAVADVIGAIVGDPALGLRWSLASVAIFYLIAIGLLWLASRSLEQDLER